MDNVSQTSEQEADSGIESTNSAEAMVYLRISVPDLNAQKCLQFHPDDTVWMAKQQILSTVAKSLKDGLNYGLFCPPLNGKAGKFLDEERALKDYPLPGPIGYLEFKYKRRIYKQFQMNPKKLKQLHTKSNLKQLMEAIRKGDVNKITRFTNAGLDPNFNDRDTGETPLTMAVTMMSHTAELILALIGGGAHLDFRNKKGLTPLHSAAQKGNEEALRVLLDFGASANYRDSHDLTPLYHAVCNRTSARCVEILLYDHALIGTTDEYGWTETHQASKSGHVQHLEQLIYYGADVSCQNSSGNTPLHICAINNQEECARVLLFRGAKKDMLNYANQDAFESAVISGNTQLAIMIKDFSPKDVVPYKDLPTYSDKRRSRVPADTIRILQRSRSNPQLNKLFDKSESSGTNCQTSAFDITNSCTIRSGRDRTARRHTDLTYVAEFVKSKSTFACDSPRSLSFSSSESGAVSVGDVEVMPNSKSPSLFLPEKLSKNVENQSVSLFSNKEHPLPRTVLLSEGEKGFGFVLRGARAPDSSAMHLDFVPTAQLPALQYFEQVEQNSPADAAGIKPGDFLLEVNGCDVRATSHDFTVKLIKDADSILTLTVLTLPLTPSSAVSGDAATTHNKESLGRRESFNSLLRSGLAELDNLDRLLMEYEKPVHSVTRGMSYADGLHHLESATDPKIASIRSVHGKRLIPGIPKPEHWILEFQPENGVCKAQSTQCLVSTTGNLSVLEKMEKYGTRPQHHLGSSSPASIAIDALTSDNYESQCVNYRVFGPDVTAKPFTTNIQNSQMASITVEPSFDPTSQASYKIMHSFSYGTERSVNEPMNLQKVTEPECDSNAVTRVVGQDLSSTCHFGVGSKVRTAVPQNTESSRSVFTVPPAPALPRPGRSVPSTLEAESAVYSGSRIPPSPPLLPSKPPSNSDLRYSSSQSSKVKVRPPVPRRRSQLMAFSELQEQGDSELMTELLSSSKTESSDLQEKWKGSCVGDDAESNFLARAEAARLMFLNQKSNDSCKMTARVPPKSAIQDHISALNNSSKGTFQLSNNLSKLSRESKDMEPQREQKSINLQEESKMKMYKCEQMKKEMNFKEELKNSLSQRVIGVNQHQRIAVDGSDNPQISMEKSRELPTVAKMRNFFETKEDTQVNDSSAFNRNSIVLFPQHQCTEKLSENANCSDLETKKAHTFNSTDLISLIIPPPPLFFSRDQNNEYSEKNNQVVKDLAVSLDPLLLAPPPPGFEDEVSTLKRGLLQNDHPQINHQTSNPGLNSSSLRHLSNSVISWSVDDVAVWLQSIHMAEHTSSFVRNQVDGARLAQLGRNELISLGVAQVGQRMTIERAIKKAIMKDH